MVALKPESWGGLNVQFVDNAGEKRHPSSLYPFKLQICQPHPLLVSFPPPCIVAVGRSRNRFSEAESTWPLLARREGRQERWALDSRRVAGTLTMSTCCLALSRALSPNIPPTSPLHFASFLRLRYWQNRTGEMRVYSLRWFHNN